VVELKTTYSLIKARQAIRAGHAYCLVRRAEDAGFEPARGCPQHAFQACALGH
jgi:hypothetical protein